MYGKEEANCVLLIKKMSWVLFKRRRNSDCSFLSVDNLLISEFCDNNMSLLSKRRAKVFKDWRLINILKLPVNLSLVYSNNKLQTLSSVKEG